MSLPNRVIGQSDIAAFSGESTPLATSVSNMSATALSRGAGISSNSGSSFNSNGFTETTEADAVTANDYVEWSVTADASYVIEIVEFELDYDRSGSGPSNVALRTSLDGYTSNIYSNSGFGTSGVQTTVDISGSPLTSAAGGTITFRLYAWGASSGSGTFDIEDDIGTVLSQANTGVRLNGSVTLNASNNEPSSVQIVEATSDKMNITWAKPSGTFNTDWDGVLVFVSDGASGIDLSLSGQDGVDYTANLTYASGTFATDGGASDNAYCVANQTTDADGDITVTGLTEGTTYYVYAYGYTEVSGNSDNDTFSSEVDGGNQSADLENLSGASPSTGNTQITLNWTNPTTTQGTYWDNIVIVAREGSAVEASVSEGNLDGLVDGSSLTANTDWSARSNTNDLYDQSSNLIGTDNTNYVVYSGTGTSTTITGLTNGTAYHFRMFVYYTEDDTDENWTTGTDVSGTPANVPSAGDVVITEIMYNTASTDDEWIEIYNASGSQLTLDASWRLSYGSNTFDFAGTNFDAGDYIVIAVGSNGDGTFNNTSEFTPDVAAVGTVATIGSTNNTNNLGNGSATISVIYDPSGSNITVDEVTYDDGSPWPTDPDGGGTSLELTDVSLDNTAGANWAAAAGVYDGGTPGSAYNTFQYDNAWNNTPSSTTGTVDASVENGTGTLSADGAINDVTIESGATLTISSNTLTVNGDITNNGTVNVSDDASLYQTVSTDANSGSGTYNVTRTTRAYSDDWQYSYWSSPVNGETMGDAFSGANTNDFYSFTASSQSWASEGSSTTMTAGLGYITTGTIGITSSESRTFSSSTVNNGDVSVSVATSGGDESGDDDYNLLGNPYPSVLDWHLVVADGDNSELSGTVFFWYHDTYPTGGNNDNADYATYNNSGGTGGNTSVTPTRYIGAGQGFFVELDAATDGTVTFKNSHRTADANTQFYKQNSDPTNRIWLALTNDQEHYNQLLIAFHPQATSGVDRLYDGIKLKGHPYVSFYSQIEDKAYAIQGQQALVPGETRTIPLGVDAWVTGNYTLAIDSLDNLPGYYDVILVDEVAQIRTDLREGGYSLDIDQADTYTDRFYLEVTRIITEADDPQTNNPDKPGNENGVTGVEEHNQRVVRVFFTAQQLVIDASEASSLPTQVLVTDMQGRTVHQAPVRDSRTEVGVQGLASGIYVVNLQYQDNTRTTHRIAVQ